MVMERDYGSEAAGRTRVHELEGRVRELEATNELLKKKCIDMQKALDAYAQRKGQTIQ